eukprot:CFRG1610T1
MDSLQTKLRPRILLCLTGSVASVKALPLMNVLLDHPSIKDKSQICVVTTTPATHFYDKSALPVKVFTDEDEWTGWTKMKDPVLHIELRRWADIAIIAPLDANTMAKLANGICDNLLTCTMRAWDMTKTVLVCPAMNTHMWTHPLTARHLDILTSFGFKVIPPVQKVLACNDMGVGAMASVDDIASAVFKSLEEYLDESEHSAHCKPIQY